MPPQNQKKPKSYFFNKPRPKAKTKLGQIWEFILAKKYWVIGCVAVLITGLLVNASFSQKVKDEARAGESAMVSVALKQNTEKLELNAPISMILTMQNSSPTESLNNLKFIVTNTVNAIKWRTGQNLNLPTAPTLAFDNNELVIPNLSVNERVEYEIVGTLQNNQIPVLAVIGKLSYNNSQGKQESQINRVLSYLQALEKTDNVFKLQTDKDKYEEKDDIILSVNHTLVKNSGQDIALKTTVSTDSGQKNSESSPVENIFKGKIFITNQKTQEQVASLDCEIKNDLCQTQTKLKPGNYTAIFGNQNENYSTIKEFLVGGETDKFVPSSQATIKLPFGSQSLNGQVAVMVEKVLSNNQELKNGWECTFVIFQGDKEITKLKAPILQDKNCRTVVEGLENGDYKITLQDSNLAENFQYQKTEKNLELKNTKSNFERNKNIELVASGLKVQEPVQSSSSSESSSSSQSSSTNNNLDLSLGSQTSSISSSTNNNLDFLTSSSSSVSSSSSSVNPANYLDTGVSSKNTQSSTSSSQEPDILKTSLFIFHTNSGNFKELKSLDGEAITIKNGELKLNIQAENVAESGNYRLWTRSENKLNVFNSQIVSVDFSDKSVGVAQNGVIFDYANLIAGQEMTFKIENLTDTSGNPASDGKCGASLYLTDQKNPIVKEGQLRSRVCEVKFEKGEVKIAGKALITFSENDNKINQSRQIEILPNNTSVTLGQFNAEYEPIRKDFTNSILIGPATDAFGNLTNLENMTLEILTEVPIDQSQYIETDEKKMNPSNSSADVSKLSFDDKKPKLDIQTVAENSKNSEKNTSNSDTDPRNLVQSNTNLKKITNISIQNGFAKVEIPASFLNADNLTFRLVDEQNKQFLIQSFSLINNSGKLILPTFPTTLKTEENLKASLTGITLKDTQIKDYVCELSITNNNTESAKTDVDFDKNGKKCNFDWELKTMRNRAKVLAVMKIGEEKFAKILNLESSVASNLFVTTTQTKSNEKNEILLDLLTSPIVDKYGLPLENKNVSWQYNGKKAETTTRNGLTRLEITADKLSDKDYKNVQNKKTLDLDIDVKASASSISKTNNLNLVLGSLEISKIAEKAKVQKMSNILPSNTSQILQFNSKTCDVLLVKNGKTEKAPTHWQGGTCFVQATLVNGSYKLIFEKDGYESGIFEVATGPKVDVVICPNENKDKSQGCLIQVQGVTGAVEILIIDKDKEYKFASSELENAAIVNQDGLAADQKYLIQISFENQNKQKVLWQQEILGKNLAK